LTLGEIASIINWLVRADWLNLDEVSMEKVIVAVIVAVLLWLVVPDLLFPTEAQPRTPLYVCGHEMPAFVLDATGVQLTSEREALQYLYTQEFVNETRLGALYHHLEQLRWRGVQYRVWTNGGEPMNSIADWLAEVKRRILATFRDEPQPKPTIIGIAYGSVYAEYRFDPTVHQARLAQYLVTLYTTPCG
jgi:hypothetical protein